MKKILSLLSVLTISGTAVPTTIAASPYKKQETKLEKPKTCLDNIFNSFKKRTLSNAPGDAWKSIKENSDSPLKIIVKKSGKSFAAGLLTGVAKGSALSIISCVADSL